MEVFNIEARLLKAASFASAKDDYRPINCVFLDKKEGKIKATDGAILCVIEDERIKKIPYSISIPIEIVKYAIKNTNKNFPFVEIYFDKEGFSILNLKMKPSDGKFPSGQNVININKEELEAVDIENKYLKINIKYIKKLGRIQKALGLNLPMFYPVYLSNKVNETELKAFKFEFLNCQVYIAPLLPKVDYK